MFLCWFVVFFVVVCCFFWMVGVFYVDNFKVDVFFIFIDVYDFDCDFIFDLVNVVCVFVDYGEMLFIKMVIIICYKVDVYKFFNCIWQFDEYFEICDGIDYVVKFFVDFIKYIFCFF